MYLKFFIENQNQELFIEEVVENLLENVLSRA